jgi:hypothetical protein
VWSDGPENYAGGSVSPGRDSHAREVKGDDPDKKGYPGPQGGGVGGWADRPPVRKLSAENLIKLQTGRQFWKRLSSTKGCNARIMMMMIIIIIIIIKIITTLKK